MEKALSEKKAARKKRLLVTTQPCSESTHVWKFLKAEIDSQQA